MMRAAFVACPGCGASVQDNAPGWALHVAVSHSGATPIVEVRA